MSYYLGIDGGGSKTLAVITDDEGRIVGRGRGGCGNHQMGAELASRSLQDAATQAIKQAGLSHEQITFSLFGLAGADREADFHILRPMIAELGFGKHDIVCDTIIGLRAGTTQPDGIVIICGNGTNSFGVNKAGQAWQCGGFGYTFGDFGGGSDLAVEAFRAVIRSWEGRGAPTLLTEVTLRTLGYSSVESMFNDYLDQGTAIPSSVAKLLFEVAEHDEVARDILRRQGIELGLSACAIIRRLGMQQDRFDAVMVGSILTRGESSYVVPYIEQEIHAVAPGCRLRKLSVEPVMGAILLAMEKAGHHIHHAIYEQLEQSLSVKESEGA